MVDAAIGSGMILVAVLLPGDEEQYAFDLSAAGTFPPEQSLACLALEVLRKAGMNPQMVRLVQARGTWQEVPSWTGRWFKIE
jgi:hypothetical protein